MVKCFVISKNIFFVNPIVDFIKHFNLTCIRLKEGILPFKGDNIPSTNDIIIYDTACKSTLIETDFTKLFLYCADHNISIAFNRSLFTNSILFFLDDVQKQQVIFGDFSELSEIVTKRKILSISRYYSINKIRLSKRQCNIANLLIGCAEASYLVAKADKSTIKQVSTKINTVKKKFNLNNIFELYYVVHFYPDMFLQ